MTEKSVSGQYTVQLGSESGFSGGPSKGGAMASGSGGAEARVNSTDAPQLTPATFAPAASRVGAALAIEYLAAGYLWTAVAV